MGPAAPAARRALVRLAVAAGQVVRTERLRRRWPMRVVADRAGISVAHLCEIEGGAPASLEVYARVLTALDLPLELAADRADRADRAERANRSASVGARQDLVHSAMGELQARRLQSADVEVAMDTPYQHYQFAGRADLVAWHRDTGALLHIENRTQFPDVQDALGSYSAKRAYLGAVLAERAGMRGKRWSSETHAIVALWSSEVLHVLRHRETTFRVTCPDAASSFEAWWDRDLGQLPPGATSTLILMDPALSVGEAYRFASLDAVRHARPRYPDYAHAAARLSEPTIASTR